MIQDLDFTVWKILNIRFLPCSLIVQLKCLVSTSIRCSIPTLKFNVLQTLKLLSITAKY